MSAFSDLLHGPRPRAWWVVVLSGVDRITGETVEFHCLQGDNHRAVVDGVVVQFRDVWAEGAVIEWGNAICRAEESADRAFWASGSARAGPKTWQVLPDAEMRGRMQSIDFKGGGFSLKGWGPHKIDGSPFPFEEADSPVRGETITTRSAGGGVIEFEYLETGPAFDDPVQRAKFGGYDSAHVISCPSAADDPVGAWIANPVPTTAFDVDGGAYSVTMVLIADEIPAPQITSEAILALSGDPAAINDCSWALLMGPLGVLTFAAKAERIVTSFTMPRFGWASISFAVEADGKTVEISAGTGRERDSISVVGSGVLAAPLSPPVGTSGMTIGNPGNGAIFIVTSGAGWGMFVAGFRVWDGRTLTLAELNANRLQSYGAGMLPRPSHLYRFAGVNTPSLIFDEDGGVDLAGFGQFIASERVPSGDGVLPDAEESAIVGRTIPMLFGQVINLPGLKVSNAFSAWHVALGFSHLHEARSDGAPFTTDVELFAVFDIDTGVANSLTVAPIGGQEDLTFDGFLAPDSDPPPAPGPGLPGQVVQLIFAPPDPNGENTVESISEDQKVMVFVGGLGGPGGQSTGIVLTPAPPSLNPYAGVVDLPLALVNVDRGTLVEIGVPTFGGSGYLGETTDETLLGVFEALVRETFGAPGSITVLPSFLDVGSAGVYLPLGGSESFRSVANRASVPNWWRWDPEPQSYTLGGFGLPGTPVVELGEFHTGEIVEIFRQRGVRSAAIGYAENDAPQDPASQVNAVPESNRAQWSQERQTITRENPNAGLNALDLEEPIKTAIYQQPAAELVADRITALIFEDLAWHRVPCPTMSTYDVEAGETVSVESLDPGLGWFAGQDEVIASWVKSTEWTIVYEVYGLADSQTWFVNGIPVTVNGKYVKT